LKIVGNNFLNFNYHYGIMDIGYTTRFYNLNKKSSGYDMLDLNLRINKDISIYSKIFIGYGDTMIDYNKKINKVAFGFSFF